MLFQGVRPDHDVVKIYMAYFAHQYTQCSGHSALMYSGEFCKPIGIASHSYRPKGVVTAVRCTLSGCTLVWKNEFVIFNLLHILPFVQSARMLSTCGKECTSKIVFVFNI